MRPTALRDSSIATSASADSSHRHGATDLPDKKMIVRATRFDPDKDEKPHLQSYEIPFPDESMVVLDALNYIKSHVDGSLSYRWSCRMGICGSCGMMVDGVP